jgi:transposase
MATERLPMRKIKEILRLKWLEGRRHRHIARALEVSVGKVSAVVRKAAELGLDWERVEKLGEAELEEAIYGKVRRELKAPLPDPASMDLELKKPGVTLQLLHVEYREHHLDGYGYTQFCEHYRRWKKKQKLVMRQVHRAGEKLFTDFAGKKPHWIDPVTGEIHEAELFVAALGASNLTYAEALESQKVPHWTAAHSRALDYIGGVVDMVVPDQLRSAVTGPCRYEPAIQRTFEEWGRHYGTVILPARPGHPRDKAKVEAAVLVAERWILARLRNQSFFSLAELNERIAELREVLNGRPMRRYGKSRRALFEELERATLKPLPSERFRYAEWAWAKVSIDYHVEIERSYYSVPYRLVGRRLEARISACTVEIFDQGERVAAHPRSMRRGKYTTEPEHMPSSHRKHLEWSPSRLIAWAAKVGPSTAALLEAILADRPHPEQGYRSCLGIMRLARGYGAERLEAASARALAARARSYRHVESILKHGLDRLASKPLRTSPSSPSPAAAHHENVRGEGHYR